MKEINKAIASKKAIQQAIISQGIDVPNNLAFSMYPSKIKAIGSEDLDPVPDPEPEPGPSILLRNDLKNGNFSSGATYWQSYENSYHSVKSNVLTNTADVGTKRPHVAQETTQKEDDVLYFFAKARVLNISCELIELSHNLTKVKSIQNPTKDTWYNLSGNTLREFYFVLGHNYNSTKGTEKMEVKETGYINLTNTFGKGKEPSAAVMDRVLKHTGYFERTISVPESVVVEAKMLSE